MLHSPIENITLYQNWTIDFPFDLIFGVRGWEDDRLFRNFDCLTIYDFQRLLPTFIGFYAHNRYSNWRKISCDEDFGLFLDAILGSESVTSLLIVSPQPSHNLLLLLSFSARLNPLNIPRKVGELTYTKLPASGGDSAENIFKVFNVFHLIHLS